MAHAITPAEDQEATFHIMQGSARRSAWHAPYAERDRPHLAPSDTAPQARGEATAAAEGPLPANAGEGGSEAASHGSIAEGLATAPI